MNIRNIQEIEGCVIREVHTPDFDNYGEEVYETKIVDFSKVEIEDDIIYFFGTQGKRTAKEIIGFQDDTDIIAFTLGLVKSISSKLSAHEKTKYSNL